MVAGVRRRSAAARLLRLWVRIPPGAWMSVFYECCVLSGRGLCDELFTRPEASYQLWCVVVCDLEISWMRRPWPTVGCCAPPPPQKKFRTNRIYLLTARREVLEKLTGHLLVKKFPAFYGTRRFITAFKSAGHLSLSWTSSIQSTPPHPTSWRSPNLMSLFHCLGHTKAPVQVRGTCLRLVTMLVFTARSF